MGKDISINPILKASDVARIIHVHSNTIWRWSNKGGIEGILH